MVLCQYYDVKVREEGEGLDFLPFARVKSSDIETHELESISSCGGGVLTGAARH